MGQTKKILVAPLDWGLGHATRCVPLIRELVAQGAEVVIAADDRPLVLLQKEFPDLTFVRLKGYGITYQQRGSLTLKMLRQLPKLRRGMRAEQKELEKIIAEKNIDAVISDNRFGLYTSIVPCVFITHQVSIKMPAGLQWLEKFIYRRNLQFINRYNYCWIPDSEEVNLSAELSRKYPLPANASFIGPLSRFEHQANMRKEYDVLAILSGPEPQRTVLEKILTEQLKPLTLKSLIVKGTPEREEQKEITPHLSTLASLGARALNEAILASDIIISRSGYSTIMDLAVLGKKAIFIPTPGQTEQEYLANHFKERKIFYAENQNSFNLQRALKESEKYTGLQIQNENTLLKSKIAALLSSLA